MRHALLCVAALVSFFLVHPAFAQNTTALANEVLPALLAGANSTNTGVFIPILDGRTVSGTGNITRISIPASASATLPNRTVTGLNTTGVVQTFPRSA